MPQKVFDFLGHFLLYAISKRQRSSFVYGIPGFLNRIKRPVKIEYNAVNYEQNE